MVGPDDRYRSKAFVDTFVYRTRDVVGAIGDGIAQRMAAPADAAAARLGAAMGAVAMLGVPPCVAWGGLGWYLGQKQAELREGFEAEPPRGVGAGRGPAVGTDV